MTPRQSPRGMALVAVLWLVAAMSIIISGVVRTVRVEAQTVGLQRQAVVAGAKADAAILLALQHLHAQQKAMSRHLQTLPVEFEGATYQVLVAPLNGLIDINNASVPLLADLYQYAANVVPQDAQTLAQATVAIRRLKNAKSMEQGFESSDDLMRVPGVDYAIYDKVHSLVTVAIKGGSGRVNPLAAPLNVLTVLTAGNAARANQFISQRDAAPDSADTTFFKPDSIDMSASTSLKLQVNVELPDGTQLQKDWRLYWGADPRSALPWRVLGTHQVLLQPK